MVDVVFPFSAHPTWAPSEAPVVEVGAQSDRMLLPTAGEVRVRQVSKRFASAAGIARILDQIDLTIAPGEFFCVVGGSGCGKSTLLRIMAGLERADDGLVTVGNQTVTRPGLDRGMVFQDPRLLPWLNVYDNVAFGLNHGSAAHRHETVFEHLKLVGLHGSEKLYPSQLSGGMAQRVGVARALVNRPGLLLLDEPFGALDALTRLQMQQELLRIWHAERTTMVLVTHDIDEAIVLGDRIAVLGGRPGVLRDLYSVAMPRPRDRSHPRFNELREAISRSIFGQHGERDQAASC